MKIVYFTHSLTSCWNHGNAHFLRGVVRELLARGHKVRVLEPADAWSLENLLRDHGAAGTAAYHAAYPELAAEAYGPGLDLEAALDGADVVVVHEWTSPDLVARIGRIRARGGRFRLLFHDTHHRAVSDPGAMRAYDLDAFDGVLAFGAALAEVYQGWGWGRRAFVWHEAADVTHFHPPAQDRDRHGLIWIGNWGDGERSSELETFLLGPATRAGLDLDIHGVRYPAEALELLASRGARYRGWAPNALAPELFASRLATVHVPRRFYVEALPGIPTIRVFEALACGIPLLSAPWRDTEGLFRPGVDFLMARDGAHMESLLREVAHDRGLRGALAAHGLETVLGRHTCAHRAAELLSIVSTLEAPNLEHAG